MSILFKYYVQEQFEVKSQNKKRYVYSLKELNESVHFDEQSNHLLNAASSISVSS